MSPPKSTLMPRTSSTFPMTEPMIEAFTTVVSPAERAKIVMISSAALPKVAFRMPPMRGPACAPRLSVACPSTQASPTSASALTVKTKMVGAFVSALTTAAAESRPVTM